MFQPKHAIGSTTIFTTMSALANQYGAVNLSQGFPDFDIDPPLAAAASKALHEGYNQYAPMPGLLALRQAIAQKVMHYQSVVINPETQITITPGATYGIYTAIATIISPGDEVIVPEPAYDSYLPNIRQCGGVPITIPMTTRFTIDWERIEQCITKRTKAIIVNNPHNPLGTVFNNQDLLELARIAEQYNLIVIADEVYEHLVYDGEKHISVCSIPALRDRSFVVHSFGKVFNATGWKIGYCIASETLMQHFRMVHQYIAFSVHTPAQKGLADYLSNLQHIEATRAMLEQKRNYFLNAMTETGFESPGAAKATFFQVMDYSNLSSLSDKEFAIWLTQVHGVAVIPLSAFYAQSPDQKLVRFCFAKKESTIDEAVRRLKQIK
jgi:methionine aminotransferase